jgi:hypothetical protein
MISTLTIRALVVSTHLVSTLTIPTLTLRALTMLQRNTEPAGEAQRASAALSQLRTLVLANIAGPGGIGGAPLCGHALTSENQGE